MKILYIYTDYFKNYDIMVTLQKMGISFDVIEDSFMTWEPDEKKLSALLEKLKRGSYQAVLSYGYVPSVSDVCEDGGVFYIAWTYDSILHSLYNKSIENKCNRLFIYDSAEANYIKEHFDAPHVYYLPLAANVDRIEALEITSEDVREYSTNVSFVGDLYQQNTYYSLLTELSDGERQYFRNAFSYFFGKWGGDSIYDWFSETDADYLQERLPDYLKNNGLLPNRRFFADTLLSKPIGSLERIEILNRLAKKPYGVRLYHKESSDCSVLNNVELHKAVNYFDEMNKAFKYSKININITLHGMMSGVPLRCFDVVASGGFLLTNYQSDLEGLFEEDNEIVCYRSIDELLEKVDYYMKHEDERTKIAKAGFMRAKAEHSYEKRLLTIFSAVGLK